MDTKPRSLRDSPQVALWVLFAVALFNYLDRSLLSILQIPIKEELGLSDTELGALTGFSFAILYAGAALPVAMIVDRQSRTRLLAGGLALWTSLTALTGFATGFLTLAILRMGVALGESVSVPATHSLLSDHYPIERRGRAFSTWAVASPLGVTIGIALGGWMGAELGWRMSFLVIGVAGFLIIPGLFFLREPRRGRFETAPHQGPAAYGLGEGIGTLWAKPAFRMLVIGTTLHSFSYQALVMWLPPFLARSHGLEMTEIAWWSALMIGVGGGIGALAGGNILDLLIRRDMRWYAWAPGIAFALFIPFAVLLFTVTHEPLVLACGLMTLMLVSFYIAPVNALAQSMVPSQLRGLTAAVLLILPTIFGVGLGPLLTGVMSDWLVAGGVAEEAALRYALIASLVGSLAAVLCFLGLGRALGSDAGLGRPPEAAEAA